jgi:hypothetical protein
VHRIKIAALVDLGRLQDAKMAAETFLTLDPTFSITRDCRSFAISLSSKDTTARLKAAGLPE